MQSVPFPRGAEFAAHKSLPMLSYSVRRVSGLRAQRSAQVGRGKVLLQIRQRLDHGQAYALRFATQTQSRMLFSLIED